MSSAVSVADLIASSVRDAAHATRGGGDAPAHREAGRERRLH
jgi:hypothetical protein